MTGFSITTNYRQVNARLRQVDVNAQKNLKRTARLSVLPIVAEARNIAAGHGFKRVPGAIVPNITGTYAGVKVRVRKSTVGVLHERSRGKWRHPVYGNKAVWRNQIAQPSLKPALKANQARVVREMKYAVRLASREAGFR